jgi:hypothetical protein
MTPRRRQRPAFAEELRRANQSGAQDGLRRIVNVLPGADRHPLIVLVDQFRGGLHWGGGNRALAVH